MMKTFSAADILKLNPCYTQEQVHAHFPDSTSRFTLRELLAKRIPVADKQWLVFCPGILTLAQRDRLFVLFRKRNPRADAYARARARAYARAEACALQAQINDVLVILSEDGE